MWNNWCTKYLSYQNTNDVAGMMAILNQIITQGFATNQQQAFSTLKGRCRELGYNDTFNFPNPENPQTSLIDCYNCREQIVSRVSSGTPCPKNWVAVPVGSNGLSQSPCPKNDAIVTSGGFSLRSGTIKGGIKQPEFYSNPTEIENKEFNIMDRNMSLGSGGYRSSNNSRSVVNGNGNGRKGAILKVHPLDAGGGASRRVIGQEVYDPISKVWKIDDGRPRGLIDDGTGKGIWGCWGKCKVKKGWWIFGSTTIKCNCNKAQNGNCHCDGCLGNASC